MFAKPPFLTTIAILTSVAAVSLIIVMPVGDDSWLELLDPVSHGVHLLRRAEGFALPHVDSRGCELPLGHATAWRTIAARPTGDSLFRHIFAKGRPGGRLYALLGLYHLRARGLPAALRTAQRDTANVWLWDWNAMRTLEVPLRTVAQDNRLATWARSLSRAAQQPTRCAP